MMFLPVQITSIIFITLFSWSLPTAKNMVLKYVRKKPSSYFTPAKRELLSLTEKSVNHSLINISNLYFSLFNIQKIHLWYKERLVDALEI